MFTTPDRSENMPPSEAKTSGVANRSVAPNSAAQVTTDLEVLDARTRGQVPDDESGDTSCGGVAADLAARPGSTSRCRWSAKRPITTGRRACGRARGAARRAPLRRLRGRRPRRRRAGPGEPAHVGVRCARVRLSRSQQEENEEVGPDEQDDSPWMMIARFDASRAGRPGVEVPRRGPVSSAAKRSAARPTPTAVFRPSSATAIRRTRSATPWIA